MEYEFRVNAALERLPELQAWLESFPEGQKRAFVIEFAGMPKAGKSSAIENIRHFFSHGPKELRTMTGRFEQGFRVHTPAEGVSLRTPNYLRLNPVHYNTWAGAYALQELLQARHDQHYDIVVLDRGPWDAGCWLEYYSTPSLAGADASAIERIGEFFRSGSWETLSDLHVVLTVDPEKASEREAEQRLIKPKGASSNSKLMYSMKRVYETNFSQLQHTKAKHCEDVGDLAAIWRDTTGMDSKAVALDAIEAALDVIHAKILHKELMLPSEVSSTIGAFTKRLKVEERHVLDKYLPTFQQRVNKLSRDQRQSVRGDLKRIAPELDFAYNRTAAQTAETLIKDLEAILVKYEP